MYEVGEWLFMQQYLVLLRKERFVTNLKIEFKTVEEKKMNYLCSFTLFLGRLCLSSIFILAGLNKFMDYNATAQYMAAKGFTMIPFFLVSAAIIEILAGILLLIGYRTRIAAAALLLYLIPTTLIFHDFWYIGDLAARQAQIIEFLKNLAIFGGLLYVAGSGPGKCSVDACCCQACGTKPTTP